MVLVYFNGMNGHFIVNGLDPEIHFNNNNNISCNLVRNSNDVIINMENTNGSFRAKPKGQRNIFCHLKIPLGIQSKMLALLSNFFIIKFAINLRSNKFSWVYSDLWMLV